MTCSPSQALVKALADGGVWQEAPFGSFWHFTSVGGTMPMVEVGH